jgi:hypothetical protein
MQAYLNYPNPHVELHSNPNCAEIQKTHKSAQRNLMVTVGTFAGTCATLKSASFHMGSSAANNDAWISADFDDPEFEEAVVRYLLRQLGKRYTRLRGAAVHKHC